MKNQQYNPTFHQLSGDPVAERVFTVADLSKMFNVSTKTISRWREGGLSSTSITIDGRKHVGFLKSSVDNFVRHNPDRVQYGRRFSQLTDTERAEIIEKATRLVDLGHSSAEVIQRLANETGRSSETIRYNIKNFDREHPERPVFLQIKDRYSATRKAIFRGHRRGEAHETIAKRHKLSLAKVSRVVREMRAARIMELPLEWIPSPEFDKPDAADMITAPMPERENVVRQSKAPTGLPAYLASLYKTPLLTPEQEVHLFRKYNYLKSTAARLRDELDVAKPKSRLMDGIERRYEEAIATKNRIIQANLRLVVSTVKRYAVDGERLFNLISDGNMSLMRAVEKFDYSRGFKFSTYASWAIKKNFARDYANDIRRRDRFKTSQEAKLFDQPDFRADPSAEERIQQQRETQVRKILKGLDDRERGIVESRFGLAPGTRPKTLQEVGNEFGVGKERARQLESRALDKLRVEAVAAKIEP